MSSTNVGQGMLEVTLLSMELQPVKTTKMFEGPALAACQERGTFLKQRPDTPPRAADGYKT